VNAALALGAPSRFTLALIASRLCALVSASCALASLEPSACEAAFVAASSNAFAPVACACSGAAR
jgi:hypothetical protein